MTSLQSIRLVVQANSAKFQQNRLIFSAASSHLKFVVSGVEVSIVLQLGNTYFWPFGCFFGGSPTFDMALGGAQLPLPSCIFCFVLPLNFADCPYSRCLKQRTWPIYRRADWAAELSSLVSSTSFQAHSSDFVTRVDNRYQLDSFGMSSNTFTFISPHFCLLFTWRTRLISWMNQILEFYVECLSAALHYGHITM